MTAWPKASPRSIGAWDVAALYVVLILRVEYDAAINAYFEVSAGYRLAGTHLWSCMLNVQANAVIDNERWLLRGSSRIKKWTYLWASMAKESTLVSKPEYDDQ